jgi:hypothetical protein
MTTTPDQLREARERAAAGTISFDELVAICAAEPTIGRRHAEAQARAYLSLSPQRTTPEGTKVCGRCGGSGQYGHYGTCFDCGGHGFVGENAGQR